MLTSQLSQQLSYVVAQRQQDEAVILAEAVREGIQAMYRDALIEAYLLGKTSRQELVNEIGLEAVDEIEYQRDAMHRDFAWGVKDD
jgi:hypothetical protein